MEMPAEEFLLWQVYYRDYGFDADRAEWASANAGAAAARSMGATVKAADLVPRFKKARVGSTLAEIRAFFENVTDGRKE